MLMIRLQNLISFAVPGLRRRKPAREDERFCALDGSSLVMIEATHEDDARHLCDELGWHFIGACDD